MPDFPFRFRETPVIVQNLQQDLINFQEHPLIARRNHSNEFRTLFQKKLFILVGHILNRIIEQFYINIRRIYLRFPLAAFQYSCSQPKNLPNLVVICCRAFCVAADSVKVGFSCPAGTIFRHHFLKPPVKKAAGSILLNLVNSLETAEKMLRIFLFLRFNLQPDIQILKDPVCCIQRRIREPPVRYDLLDNRVHCENRVVYSNPALPVKSSDIVSVW